MYSKNRYPLVCFLMSVVISLDCTFAVKTSSNTDLKLIGGQNATKNEFPWLVNFLTPTGIFCGGAILTEEWILTSGSCGELLNNGVTIINAGDYNLLSTDDQEQNAKCQKVVVHENYARYTPTNIINDIALILLETPLQFNLAIQAIKLPEPTLDTASGDVTLAGWGGIHPNESYSPLLQKVNLPIVPLSQCQRTYSSARITITNDMLCTGTTGKSPCHGDGGSPLLCHGATNTTFVCGIVSFGGDCANQNSTNFPSVNTKITSYLPWIKSVMNNNSNSPDSSKLVSFSAICFLFSIFHMFPLF